MDDDNVLDNQSTDSPDEEKKFTHSDMERAIKARLQQKDKREAVSEAKVREIQDELAALKAQITAGTPTPQQAAQSQQTQSVQMPPSQQGQTQQQSIQPESPDVTIAKHEFNKKLMEAAEKDPEFKKLIGDESAGTGQTGNFIPPQILPAFHHLSNAAAVIKHLKTNAKDHALVASTTTPYELKKALNDISDKLEQNSNAPHPSDYEPEPSLSDTGTADQPYSAVGSWKKRYKR